MPGVLEGEMLGMAAGLGVTTVVGGVGEVAVVTGGSARSAVVTGGAVGVTGGVDVVPVAGSRSRGRRARCGREGRTLGRAEGGDGKANETPRAIVRAGYATTARS